MIVGIIGGIISAILSMLLFYFVIEPLLPSKFREKIHFKRKSIFKWLHNENIEINLVVKTTSLNNKKLELCDFKDKLKKELQINKFQPNDDDRTLSICTFVGNHSINAKIDFMTYVIDDKEIVESLQFNFSDTSKFRKFETYAYELNIAKNNIEKILKNIIPEFTRTMSFTCKLKALPEINGILHSTNFNTLDCTTPDGKNFEITENQITWYDIEINRDMLNFLKNMIISYA